MDNTRDKQQRINENYKTFSPFARANFLALDKEACKARNVVYDFPFDISDIGENDIEEFVSGLSNYTISQDIDKTEMTEEEKKYAYNIVGWENHAYCTYSEIWLNIVRECLDRNNVNYVYIPKEVNFHGKKFSTKHRLFFPDIMRNFLWVDDPRSREFFEGKLFPIL